MNGKFEAQAKLELLNVQTSVPRSRRGSRATSQVKARGFFWLAAIGAALLVCATGRATTPTITWTNPAVITYGTALGSNQLNATANVPGSFAYSPAGGTVLSVGTNALSVVFTPTDIVDYTSTTGSVSLVVLPAPLTVTAADASRFYGQTNPVFTGRIAGVTNGDNITATYSCSATTNSPVGTYDIVPSLVDPNNLHTNYMVSLVKGTLTVLSNYAEPYIITTLAGLAGNQGSADATGSAARFFVPSRVAVDGAGNAYVADSGNDTIRKVTAAGVVTTLAGLAGSSGSADGTGSDARFAFPAGVAVDTNGNLYVADELNDTIRKVTPVGTNWVVTTLAGLAGSAGSADGIGSAARFDFPADVVADGAGNLYVADKVNDTIRKMTPVGTNWVVTTLAGLAGSAGSADGTGSAARFDQPNGVAADANGNLYVADELNDTIRKVTSAGVVTTLAGLAGSFGSADGTGSAARFVEPAGVAVDSAGNVYVADQYNHTIRKVTAAGAVTTLAGLAGNPGDADGTGSDARFFYPNDVAVDNNGNFCVADTYNDTIRKGYPTEPPVIVTPPQSTNVAVGSSVTFDVVATGTAPLSYQWQFNGVNLPGATGSSFNIPSAFVGNGGVYQVVVSSPYGSVTSSGATLGVYTPPMILQQPVSAEVAVGGSAAFRVVASSSAPLSYQWFFGGTNIAGATNGSYNVVNAQLTDAGNYNAVVSTPAGSVTSSNAALIVVVPPPPPPPLPSYTLNIQPGLNLIANQLNSGGNTLNEIMPVVPDGTVVSKYLNASGTWIRSTYQASSGTWVPDNITLNPGDGAFLDSPSNFSLTLTGTPQAPVLPVAIPSGVAYLLSRQTNDVGTYESIVGAAPPLGAVFFKWVNAITNYIAYTNTSSGWTGGVEPTVAVGKAAWIGTNGGAPAPVPEAPSITNQPISVSVGLGGSVVFNVAATGSQPLFYQWFQNGNQIPAATNSSLTVTNVQLNNAGNYSVTVNNSVGVADSAIVSLTISNIASLPFADDFGSAGSLGSATNGAGFSSNAGATLEPGEPDPNGIPIGASVWVQWQPQSDGIASFTTAGSDFNTVLAVYTGDSLDNLVLVGANAGAAPFLWGSLSFNAVAGTTYFIQVSGFYGASGPFALSWNEIVTANQLPVITAPPQSQSVPIGTNVTLSVGVQDGGSDLFQWFLGNNPVPGATSATLTLSNVDFPQAGFYTVQVTDPQSLQSVTSKPAHLVIIVTGPGFTGNAAFISGQDMFQNATALTPPDPNIVGDPAPCGGYTGAINDGGNTLASAQPGEPNHCGYPACHSVWYSYVSPGNGLLTVSLFANNFNAILAVYTGPGNSFSNLVSVACSANHGLAGEKVTFSTFTGETNWIVVDGVNCASGNYTLGWSNAVPPAITLQPVGQTVPLGSSLTLSATASGAPALSYQWQSNGTNLPGANASSYAIQNFQPANAGGYQLVVANSYATVTSLTAMVTAVFPLSITTSASPPAGGSTSGAGGYNIGQTVTVTATPNACYSFSNWTESGSVVSSSAIYTFTASASRNLVANFVLNSYSITTASQPAGGGTTSGGGTYNCGASVTVTATANAPYQFLNWTEGGTVVSANASYSFTVAGNRALVANFTQLAVVTVLASPTNGGTTTGSGSYAVPSRVTISAQPNSGWKFTQWSDGSLLPTRANLSLPTAGAYTYTADFIPTNIVLSSPALSASGFNCELNGPVGTSYRIDFSGDLVNWQPLTSFTSSSSPVLISDPAAGGQSQRFYRAVWLAP